MKQEEINQLLAEIVCKTEIINIDINNIERFREMFVSIDATKVSGKNYEIGELLERAIKTVKAQNGDKPFSGLFFAIMISKGEGLPIEHITSINDVLEQVDNTVECVWGIAERTELKGDNVEIIVVLGFDKIQTV